MMIMLNTLSQKKCNVIIMLMHDNFSEVAFLLGKSVGQ